MNIKSFITTVMISFLLIATLGCGYFDNDKIQRQENIIGNISIIKQENDQASHLAIEESPGLYAVIIEDCKTVYFDTPSKALYVEQFLNEANSSYFQIEVINATSPHVFTAVRKLQLEKIEYDQQVKSLSKKWVQQ